jgi:hemin uptake protein HemP
MNGRAKYERDADRATLTEPIVPSSGGERRPIGAAVEMESRDLSAGRREIMIRYRNVIYRLRETRTGKLILTK